MYYKLSFWLNGELFRNNVLRSTLPIQGDRLVIDGELYYVTNVQPDSDHSDGWHWLIDIEGVGGGHVKVSSKATWSKDEHPESPEQHPILELRIELTDYTSRKTMANMLRLLANYVDEGALHPFDPPLAERTLTGTWDDENHQWVISED